ncbi:unnamed protein product [Musa acuminata subsp. burmannicoides]
MESPMARSADSSPMHKHHNGKQVVPNPGAREIARYRQDMLDMVREMPESAYELTLRDMVETPRIAQTVQETIEKRREEAKDKAEKVKDQSKGKRRLLRKESMETGVFLRMFVPISLGGGRRKSSGGSNTCAKVLRLAPMMPPDDGRTRNACIWFVSCFFFLILLVGGSLLVIYIVLPESQDTFWFPIAGFVLVGIPWLFWITTCIYRSVMAPKYDIERPPVRAAAVAPAAVGAAAANVDGDARDDSSLNSHESEEPLASSMS